MEKNSNKKVLKINKEPKEINHSSHYEKEKLYLKNQNDLADIDKDFDWDWIFDREWLRIKK